MLNVTFVPIGIGAVAARLSVTVVTPPAVVTKFTVTADGTPAPETSMPTAIRGVGANVNTAFPTAVGAIVAIGPLSAQRAHDLGMVNVLVEPGQALARAMALAEQIAGNAPIAVRETRKVVVWIEEHHEGVETETHHGGQPLYPYFVGIE